MREKRSPWKVYKTVWSVQYTPMEKNKHSRKALKMTAVGAKDIKKFIHTKSDPLIALGSAV